MGVDLSGQKLNNHEAGIAVHLPSENGETGDIMPAGDCEKGSGRLLTAWPFVLARVREIWQISRVIVREFLRRSVCGW